MPNVAGAPLFSSETAKFQWRRIFDDSNLDGLIADAFSEYPELKCPAANLKSVCVVLFPATTVSALRPLFELTEAHVFAAERLHCDNTTVPLLPIQKTITARL